MTQLPIPVHVGSQPPADWDDIEARQRQYGDAAGPWLQDQHRPPVASPSLDWDALGFEPRWVGLEAATCAAALHPSIYTGRGAEEFDRFRQGAGRRGEMALVISPVGDLGETSRNAFGPRVDSLQLNANYTYVEAQPLGDGATVRPAPDIGDVDSDLALRLSNCRPVPRWRSLALNSAFLETPHGRQQPRVEGVLLPILESELGEPVVAAWVSADGAERRYIVPAETPWPLLLQWLHEKALPEYVPQAMRRARRHLATDQAFMTLRERRARSALASLAADYASRRAEIERQLEAAQGEATTAREGLLYGTGSQLVDAVRSVFEWADIMVVDLDVMLDGPRNADLLCTYRGHSRLVEVKAASGRAPERAYDDLVRHLREWPSLPDSTPVEGGALVLNHEHRSLPGDRSESPYTRPEFLAARVEPIITTLALFAAWCEEDVPTVRRLLFGSNEEPNVEVPIAGVPPLLAPDPGDLGARRRRWFRRR